MKIDDIPAELLYEIIKQLDRRSFLYFSQANGRIRELCQNRGALTDHIHKHYGQHHPPDDYLQLLRRYIVAKDFDTQVARLPSYGDRWAAFGTSPSGALYATVYQQGEQGDLLLEVFDSGMNILKSTVVAPGVSTDRDESHYVARFTPDGEHVLVVLNCITAALVKWTSGVRLHSWTTLLFANVWPCNDLQTYLVEDALSSRLNVLNIASKKSVAFDFDNVTMDVLVLDNDRILTGNGLFVECKPLRTTSTRLEWYIEAFEQGKVHLDPDILIPLLHPRVDGWYIALSWKRAELQVKVKNIVTHEDDNLRYDGYVLFESASILSQLDVTVTPKYAVAGDCSRMVVAYTYDIAIVSFRNIDLRNPIVANRNIHVPNKIKAVHLSYDGSVIQCICQNQVVTIKEV